MNNCFKAVCWAYFFIIVVIFYFRHRPVKQKYIEDERRIRKPEQHTYINTIDIGKKYVHP